MVKIIVDRVRPRAAPSFQTEAMITKFGVILSFHGHITKIYPIGAREPRFCNMIPLFSFFMDFEAKNAIHQIHRNLRMKHKIMPPFIYKNEKSAQFFALIFRSSKSN